jgi:acetylornithine deacetylase/succinyl-diaminopimelate desuccinylase-like protein
LRIPSISALPDHADDVQRSARWVADRLQSAGIEGVRVLPTGGHPVVYGEWLHAPGRPTILIYGHFDTQAADPLELWSSPPFEPDIRDGRIYARGASDDKGNMLIPILAIEAILRTDGSLPLNLKFFFEGQEEIGSPQLPAFIAAHRELLACDLAVSADSPQWDEDKLAILVGLRGTCAVQIDIYEVTRAGRFHQVIQPARDREDRVYLLAARFDDCLKGRAEGGRIPVGLLMGDFEEAPQRQGVLVCRHHVDQAHERCGMRLEDAHANSPLGVPTGDAAGRAYQPHRRSRHRRSRYARRARMGVRYALDHRCTERSEAT